MLTTPNYSRRVLFMPTAATLPETFDPAEDLTRYTTDQLRMINAALETELLRVLNEEAAALTDAQKVLWLDAVAYLNRVGGELLRRSELSPAGPTGVCLESLPDGSGTVRLSFTILAF